MKKGRGKQKGNRYEIKISNILSKWYKDDGKDYFWRTSGSGARATLLKKSESPFVGDITFLPNPDALIPIIECKDRKEITFDNVYTEKFKPFQYWYEVGANCSKLNINKPIWVIFKIHNYPEDFVCIDKSFLDWRSDAGGGILYDYKFLISSHCFYILKLSELLDFLDHSFKDKVIKNERIK